MSHFRYVSNISIVTIRCQLFNVFIIRIIQKFLIHNTGDCKCGTSCRMGNGRIGTCQDDNKTCAQNINQPFCPEGKYNQNLTGAVKVEHLIVFILASLI